MATPAEVTFRRLAIGDPRLIGAIGDQEHRDSSLHRLDDRTESLLRIGALVALDAPQSSYDAEVGAAQRAGADLEDVLAVLAAIAGAVGSVRVIAAAPRIALAAGYDIETALELNDPSDHEQAGSLTPP
jgi:alkylhydroperoxidase/carboxymuconolactone decarboxylase family protein YurZ